jgi:hypothetical protein
MTRVSQCPISLWAKHSLYIQFEYYTNLQKRDHVIHISAVLINDRLHSSM